MIAFNGGLWRSAASISVVHSLRGMCHISSPAAVGPSPTDSGSALHSGGQRNRVTYCKACQMLLSGHRRMGSQMTKSASRFTGTDNPGDTLDAYLTDREFCQRYRVSARTAQRWRMTGDGPPFLRLGGRKIVYRFSDAETWAAGRTFATRADELSRTVAP